VLSGSFDIAGKNPVLVALYDGAAEAGFSSSVFKVFLELSDKLVAPSCTGLAEVQCVKTRVLPFWEPAAEATLGYLLECFKLSVQLPPDKLVDIARYRCRTPILSINRSPLGKDKDPGFAFFNISHQWL
jgi:hypothetical protein